METTPQIERHLSANMNLKKRQIILYNFLGGLAWGFGTVVGATVVVAVVVWILTAIGVFSFVGNFFNQLNAVQQLPQIYK